MTSINHSRALKAALVLLLASTSGAAFAQETYSTDYAQTIGRRGRKLTADEARKLLAMPLYEIPVYRGAPVDVGPPKTGPVVFAPSKPGPVSQQPYMVPEAEGPKHLYILRLRGKVAASSLWLARKRSRKLGRLR